MAGKRSKTKKPDYPREIDEKNLFSSTGADLLDLMERNLAPDHCDLEIASAAFLELKRRGKGRRAKKIIETFGSPLIPWLSDARNALSILEPPPSGRYQGHVYVILLGGYTEYNGHYVPYVGSSKYKPETRFNQHLAGINASRKVDRRGLQLIKSLGWPWRTIPGDLDNRILWESALNRCLALAVPKVEGDYKPPSEWPRGFQEPLKRRLVEEGLDVPR